MFCKANRMLLLLLFNVFTVINTEAQSVVFEVGTDQWNGTFPGPGTFSETRSGITVNGSAARIVNNSIDATAVFSGNEDPAISRNFSYSFPPNSEVSIDFFHLTVNSSDLPESVGNFSSAPSSINLGTGHELTGLDLTLQGTAMANAETTSTLTWTGIETLSFAVASNGNVAFVGHRNLQVIGTGSEAVPAPTLSFIGLLLLIIALLALVYLFRHQLAR